MIVPLAAPEVNRCKHCFPSDIPDVGPAAMSLLVRRPPRLPLAAHRYASTAAHSRSSSWRTAAYVSLLAFSTGVVTVYYLDARSAVHRYVLTPVMRSVLNAEASHKFAVKVLRSGCGPKDPVPDDPRLGFEVCTFLPAPDMNEFS
jgi:hypothetical protein